ncbi:3-methyladenine DNA glycosylase AlkD [Yoonia maritima]|uniref:3-methyladenine DNA glycosylase AlkD n=1 Tax=Yoonia maritima TaxID=1435347 RepID=A0A2T0W4Q6_9RHOB|nr:DNA alkylation repair protein [Yoonia maritima]PRY80242.1 3-methyladenine DNA glycosylase AlkD [Yoonia maritima]
MTTKREALDALRAAGDPAKAAEMHRYHKVDRPYLGLTNPAIDDMVKEWRAEDDLDARLTLARGLWKSNVHEARIAAAKLLVQARIRPDDSEAWALIASWVPDLDEEAIADQVSTAGQKRLVADPTRLDHVAKWAVSDHMWTRRAALTMTLPWTKKNNPKPTDLAVRDRVMGWAAGYITDQDRQIQKALGLWLRELSKHDTDRVQMFLTRHAADMKPSTVKTAQRNLPA